MISILDLKKDDKVKLAGTGWLASIKGSTRGHTTLCYVNGLYAELGSVYTTDIVAAWVDGKWVGVEHTPGQVKAAAKRAEAGW